MDLVAGDKVLIEFSTFSDRFLSVVTEVKDDGRIYVFSPINQVVIERFNTDSKALLKYAHDGQLLGFATRVLNRVASSGTILELESPRDVFDAEERSEVRCSCRFPATVSIHGEDVSAVVVDMSASCSRIRLLNGGDAFPVGKTEESTRLTFYPFDMDNGGYSVRCAVKAAFMKDGKHYAVLEYDRSDEMMRKRIAGFIEGQVCCGIPRL